MLVSIHQPEHIPWIPYFAKMAVADEHLLLDHVAFRKNYFHNRNKVAEGSRHPEQRAHMDARWLGLAVQHEPLGTPLTEVGFAAGKTDALSRYLSILRQSYRGAPYLHLVLELVAASFADAGWTVADLNTKLIAHIATALGVKTPTRSTTSMIARTTKSVLIADLVLESGAATYLSGPSGPSYLQVDDFVQRGLNLKLLALHDSAGCQTCKTLVPDLRLDLSAIDLLCRYSPETVQEWMLHYVEGASQTPFVTP